MQQLNIDSSRASEFIKRLKLLAEEDYKARERSSLSNTLSAYKDKKNIISLLDPETLEARQLLLECLK